MTHHISHEFQIQHVVFSTYQVVCQTKATKHEVCFKQDRVLKIPFVDCKNKQVPIAVRSLSFETGFRFSLDVLSILKTMTVQSIKITFECDRAFVYSQICTHFANSSAIILSVNMKWATLDLEKKLSSENNKQQFKWILNDMSGHSIDYVLHILFAGVFSSPVLSSFASVTKGF